MIASRLILLLTLCCSAHAVVLWGDQVRIVQDLPDTEFFTDEQGRHLDLGIVYRQLRLLWVIPLWNYDERYAYVSEGGETHLEVREDVAASQLKEAGVRFGPEGLGFWNRAGGKLLFLLLLPFLLALPSARTKGGAE